MKTTTETKSFDHALWIGKLKQFKLDLSDMEARLETIAAARPHKEALARLEHFQNQFIVQRSNINDILHAVKMDEKNQRVQSLVNGESTGAPYPKEWDLAETFGRTMQELRADFDHFSEKWMHRKTA